MHACAIFRKLCRRQRRPVGACESGHDFWIGMACAACLRHALRVHFRLRIFSRPNPVDAMATHARWRAVVVFLKQCPPMRAVLELRQLIGRQRWIELVHFGRIGMAARAKLNDPRAILLSIFLGPFFHMIVTEISGGIASVTARARNATSKMDVLHDFLEIHVRSRRLSWPVRL